MMVAAYNGAEVYWLFGDEFPDVVFDGVTPDDSGRYWLITKDSGFSGSASPRPTRNPMPSAGGAYKGPNWNNSRVVSLDGYVFCPDPPSRDAADRAISAAFRSPLGLSPVTRVTELGALTLEVERDSATLVETLMAGDLGTILSFSFQLAAPDPRRHGDWTSANTTLPMTPAGGIDATTAGGIDATTAGGISAGGNGALGLITLTNAGTADAYPLIIFSGDGATLSSPRIQDILTGQTLTYNGVLSSTDSVVINADSFTAQGYPPHSVLLGGTADRSNLLSLLGNWPSVPPGQSRTWAFTSGDSGNTLSHVTMSIRPEYD